MFLQPPFSPLAHLQDLVFGINTLLLIIFIAAAELVYAEAPPRERRLLRYAYPIFAVLSGLLLFAAYRQVGW